MYTVYALVDPRHDTIRYIGLTSDVYVRFSQHLQEKGINQAKQLWLNELKELQIMPIMRTLEVADSLERAREREAYWIQFYLKAGLPLTNIRKPTSPVLPESIPNLTPITTLTPGILCAAISIENYTHVFGALDHLYNFMRKNGSLETPMVADQKLSFRAKEIYLYLALYNEESWEFHVHWFQSAVDCLTVDWYRTWRYCSWVKQQIERSYIRSPYKASCDMCGNAAYGCVFCEECRTTSVEVHRKRHALYVKQESAGPHLPQRQSEIPVVL